jgi:hypothetical protein
LFFCFFFGGRERSSRPRFCLSRRLGNSDLWGVLSPQPSFFFDPPPLPPSFEPPTLLCPPRTNQNQINITRSPVCFSCTCARWPPRGGRPALVKSLPSSSPLPLLSSAAPRRIAHGRPQLIRHLAPRPPAPLLPRHPPTSSSFLALLLAKLAPRGRLDRGQLPAEPLRLALLGRVRLGRGVALLGAREARVLRDGALADRGGRDADGHDAAQRPKGALLCQGDGRRRRASWRWERRRRRRRRQGRRRREGSPAARPSELLLCRGGG